jgi:hypothetical protein
MIENSAITWLKNAGKTLSPLGEKVAIILGDVYHGIYHIDDEVRHKRTDWSDPYSIEIVIFSGLSTFDSDNLTRLVILCHDHCVRLNISAKAHNYLSLLFSARAGRDGNMSKRHPTIEQAIALHRPDAESINEFHYSNEERGYIVMFGADSVKVVSSDDWDKLSPEQLKEHQDAVTLSRNGFYAGYSVKARSVHHAIMVASVEIAKDNNEDD